MDCGPAFPVRTIMSVAKQAHGERGAPCCAGSVTWGLEALTMGFLIWKGGEEPSYFQTPGYAFGNGFVS